MLNTYDMDTPEEVHPASLAPEPINVFKRQPMVLPTTLKERRLQRTALAVERRGVIKPVEQCWIDLLRHWNFEVIPRFAFHIWNFSFAVPDYKVMVKVENGFITQKSPFIRDLDRLKARLLRERGWMLAEVRGSDTAGDHADQLMTELNNRRFWSQSTS